jgi:hypothetical protein
MEELALIVDKLQEQLDELKARIASLEKGESL